MLAPREGRAREGRVGEGRIGEGLCRGRPAPGKACAGGRPRHGKGHAQEEIGVLKVSKFQ